MSTANVPHNSTIVATNAALWPLHKALLVLNNKSTISHPIFHYFAIS